MTISGVVPEARATRAYAQVRVAVEHILATSPRVPSSSISFSINSHMNFFTPGDPFAHVIRMFWGRWIGC